MAFLLPLAEGLYRVSLLALINARDNAWQLAWWASVQRNTLAGVLAEGGSRAAARGQGDLEAARAVAAMSQRLLDRLEEPLQELLLLARRPLMDATQLPPLLPPALRDALAGLSTPASLCTLLLLAAVVTAAAAAGGALSGRRRPPDGARSAVADAPGDPLHMTSPAAAAAADPSRPARRAAALVGLSASAAVLLRLSWSPLTSMLEGLGAPPGGAGAGAAAAAGVYSFLAAMMTLGSTSIAMGAVARLLLTSSLRAAVVEAAGAVAIAAALHKALLLADTVLALLAELPAAAKLRALVGLALYGLATEALAAVTEEKSRAPL